jgi:hypothetical protein
VEGVAPVVGVVCDCDEAAPPPGVLAAPLAVAFWPAVAEAPFPPAVAAAAEAAAGAG